MDQETVVHVHSGILLCHEQDEIMPFVATWVELEAIMLSETSQAQNDKTLYSLTPM